MDNRNEYSPKTFAGAPIEQPIRKEVYYKFEKFDFTLGPNPSDPRPKLYSHFGIMYRQQWYYWSFTKRGFFHGESHGFRGTGYYQNLMQMRKRYEDYKRIMALPEAYFAGGDVLKPVKSTTRYGAGSGANSGRQQTHKSYESVRQTWHRRQAHQQFMAKMAAKYPNLKLTADDFICPHLPQNKPQQPPANKGKR